MGNLRALAGRLMRARTPAPRQYARYLDAANLYADAYQAECPTLRLPHGFETEAELEFRRSILFKRDYLIAWARDEQAFKEALPGLDAIMSPVLVSWMPRPLPLVVAPARHQGSRASGFLSVLEHEIVHANQAIAGLAIPELQSGSLRDVIEYFFEFTRFEYEAHLFQNVHWPPGKLTFGTVKLSLDQWILLRAYTPALEEVLRGISDGRIRRGNSGGFLNGVPDQAGRRLSRIGCGKEVISWFRARWSMDVACALRVLESQGVDPRSAALAKVTAWLIEVFRIAEVTPDA
jgi:hypothetical protein